MSGLDLYYEIKKQREDIDAPVDSMGCASGPDATEEEEMLYILVSLLLSSQTKDQITHETMRRLREMLPEDSPGSMENGLTVENIGKASTEYLHHCIRKVGFHRKKAENLKKIGSILAEKGLPRTTEDTLRLPGIGNKMAVLYMNHACGKVVGISVDTHVHRVSNRIGLVSTKDPPKTQVALQKVFPREEWKDVNHVLVGFGQTICTARGRKCSRCCVRGRCPSSLF